MGETQLDMAMRVSIAALIGLAAGLEREWSGHASGPDARFAGLRTFFMLGLLGGAVGILASHGLVALATAIALGGAALSITAYAMAMRRADATPDGTTEAAALVVIALGALAGAGWVGIAAGSGAVVVLMLSEKARLHWLVRRLGEPELHAGLQFAVLAVVVLPLLPTGPYFGPLAVKPRMLWAIVLVFSGLNFVGFVARRVAGANRGLGITGALGGLVSSTAVTISFSRQSRDHPALGGSLAGGVLAASTMLVPRVIAISAAFTPAVALSLVPLLAPMFLVGAAVVVVGWRDRALVAPEPVAKSENPLRLWIAIRMAVAFQAAMVLITLVREAWGTPGLYASAVALGLSDMDALAVSMSRPEAGLNPAVAARAIAIGVTVNTVLKGTLAIALGAPGYRRRVAGGLAGLVAAGAIGLLLA